MSEDVQTLIAKFHEQTARIEWPELERYFAKNVVWVVDESLDLIQVACAMAQDQAREVKTLIENNKLKRCDVGQAEVWSKLNTTNEKPQSELWAVVVAPWVLVQQRSVKKEHQV